MIRNTCLFLAIASCATLSAQTSLQWSFDHIASGEKPALFLNNQGVREQEGKLQGNARLTAASNDAIVTDQAKREFHHNISTFHSPAGELGSMSVPVTQDAPREGSFTLEAFVRYPSKEQQVFLRQMDYNREKRHGFEVGVRPEGRLHSRVDIVTTKGSRSFAVRGPAKAIANDGNWHHVAFVYNAEKNTATLYLDGVAGEPFTAPAPLVRPKAPLLAGKLHIPQSELWLDEVRLSEEALEPAAFLSSSANRDGLKEVPSVTRQPAYPLELQAQSPRPDVWGIRPAEGDTPSTTPPSFVWPPQNDVSTWELEVLDAQGGVAYTFSDNSFNAHRPSVIFSPGKYSWRYRGKDSFGRTSNWSTPRTFTIDANAAPFALPTREELLAKIPTEHPRLFLTPNNLEQWKEHVRGEQAEDYASIRRIVNARIKERPDTTEPRPYNNEERSNRAAWHAQWSANTRQTNEAAVGAYLMGFVARIEGDEQVAAAGVSLFADLLQWDPKGSTSWGNSSEASYVYLWAMARAYTLLYPWLSPEQRTLAQQRLSERTDVLYRSMLARPHLWRPFGSHQNRIWHFIGEAALALHGEVPEADDWLWFSMNVFANVYPVWGAEDGGWHEGSAYHSSYINRFFWWVIIMQETLGINAFDALPFFRNAGDFVLYTMPPGKKGGGWGDQAELSSADRIWNQRLMQTFASFTGNGYYQDYADRIARRLGEKPAPATDLPQMFLSAYPQVQATDISGLPTSKVFRDSGQVVFNGSLADAKDTVQVQFKAADFYGLFSHGYEANNSFKVWAYGERMLIKTGFRDSYGSAHHEKWMWSTRSVNNITVDGKGQFPHSILTRATLVDTLLSPRVDAVVGEAAQSYFQKKGEPSLLDRYTRAVVFIKPATVIVVDYLSAPQPHHFEYWLHAQKAFELGDAASDKKPASSTSIRLNNNGVTMDAQLLASEVLRFSQTDQYDPNPFDHVTLREWHLTATTAQATKSVRFIAAYTFSPPDAAAAKLNYTVQEQQGETLLQVTDINGDFTLLTLPQLLNGKPTGESIKIESKDAAGKVLQIHSLRLQPVPSP